ncbi:MAG: AP endonuclease, partial [Lachnospiraceae bacterium]|nr:AP endonuclease [Lachnospiraceae bacterium]
HIIHVHNKCWHMTENYEEPSIDNENVVRLLKESGYDGYIATEFEGQRYFHDVGCEENADEIEEVRRNQEMLKRLLGE